jgi:hypothetical protein
VYGKMSEKKYIIPKVLLRSHCGMLTNFWFIKNDRELEKGDIICLDHLETQFQAMELFGDTCIVALGIRLILNDSENSVQSYNGSESDWEEDAIREALGQLLAYILSRGQCVFGEMIMKIKLLEVEESVWRGLERRDLLAALDSDQSVI